MKRSSGVGTFTGLILMVLLFIARPGCNLPSEPVVQDYYPAATEQPVSNGNVYQTGNQSKVPGNIIMGSFNIQTFGPAKAGRPDVMRTLADVVRKFDFLAIQELRNEDQTVIAEFIKEINSDGSSYSYIVGPRQGRTYSKEQYAFIFDTAKFRRLGEPYVAPNPNGVFHRAPLVARFECLQAPQGQGFTFTALNIHVDPDREDRDAEFAALESVMPAIAAHHPDEDDFIVMGDFNDSERGIKNYRWMQHQLPLIRSTWATKVRSGRSIDNIVIDSLRTIEYRNQSGVLNLGYQYNLDEAGMLKLSDHFPVWAVFSTQEMKARYASASDNQSTVR